MDLVKVIETMGIPETRKFVSQSLIFLGIGAGLMYLLDPDLGERRRARLREKATGIRHDAEHFVDARSEEIRNRAADKVSDVAKQISVLAEEAERLVRSVSSLIGTQHSASGLGAYQGAALSKDASTAASAGGSRKTASSVSAKSVDEPLS